MVYISQEHSHDSSASRNSREHKSPCPLSHTPVRGCSFSMKVREFSTYYANGLGHFHLYLKNSLLRLHTVICLLHFRAQVHHKLPKTFHHFLDTLPVLLCLTDTLGMRMKYRVSFPKLYIYIYIGIVRRGCMSFNHVSS